MGKMLFFLSLALFTFVQADPIDKSTILLSLSSEKRPDTLALFKAGEHKKHFIIDLNGQKNILKAEKLVKHSAQNYTIFAGTKESENHAVLTIYNKRIVGTITIDSTHFSVSTDLHGDMILTKEQPGNIPYFEEDSLLPPPPEHLTADAPALFSPPAEKASAQDSDSSITIIDLMVLYTRQFTDYYGIDTQAMILNYVDQANDVFQRTNINAYFNLIHTQLADSSDYNESVSLSTAIGNLRNDAAVQSLRNTHHADMVTLYRKYPDEGNGCGIGYLLFNDYQDQINSFEPYAYNIVNVKRVGETTHQHPYYCGDLTMTHELGHNLGCTHDRDHTHNTGLFDYSYGYDHDDINNTKDFATVMSYDRPEIPYFSDHTIFYEGNPIGIVPGEPNEANCALTIRHSKEDISNFYTPNSCPEGFMQKQGNKKECVYGTPESSASSSSASSCPPDETFKQGTDQCIPAIAESASSLSSSSAGCQVQQGTDICL